MNTPHQNTTYTAADYWEFIRRGAGPAAAAAFAQLSPAEQAVIRAKNTRDMQFPDRGSRFD